MGVGERSCFLFKKLHFNYVNFLFLNIYSQEGKKKFPGKFCVPLDQSPLVLTYCVTVIQYQCLETDIGIVYRTYSDFSNYRSIICACLHICGCVYLYNFSQVHLHITTSIIKILDCVTTTRLPCDTTLQLPSHLFPESRTSGNHSSVLYHYSYVIS